MKSLVTDFLKQAAFKATSVQGKLRKLDKKLQERAFLSATPEKRIFLEDIKEVLDSPDVIKAFRKVDENFKKRAYNFSERLYLATNIISNAAEALPPKDMPALAEYLVNSPVIQTITKDRGKIYDEQVLPLSNMSNAIRTMLEKAKNTTKKIKIAETLATNDVGRQSLQHSLELGTIVQHLSKDMSPEQFAALLTKTNLLGSVPPILAKDHLDENTIDKIALAHCKGNDREWLRIYSPHEMETDIEPETHLNA